MRLLVRAFTIASLVSEDQFKIYLALFTNSDLHDLEGLQRCPCWGYNAERKINNF